MLTELKTAIENNKLILFVGAGMSMNLGFPNWNKLIEKILRQLQENHEGKSPMNFQYFIDALENRSKNVFEILNAIENNGYKKEAKEILYKVIKEIEFNEDDLKNQKKLWQISDKIITTNYDKLIETVKPNNIEDFANDNEFQQYQISQGKPFLYKIHGDIKNPDTCILFKSDYEELYTGDKPNTQTLRNLLQNQTLLFLGFSLEDPFINEQISYLHNLYKGYGNTHVIVLTSQKDFNEYKVKTHKVDDWNVGFDTFLDELIELKNTTQKALQITDNKETIVDIDVSQTEDIFLLESIFEEKKAELTKQKTDETAKLTKEILKIKDRILELQMQKYDIDFQQKIPDFQQHEIAHLFDTIYNSPKLSAITKNQINELKTLDNGKYKWYHRSVIVSALACSIINHKDLDPTKIDFLIDFANDAEDKVWQKAITYLFLTLNHLNNKWMKFTAIQTKLKRLKDHPEIQEALKDIIKIMQFEFQSKSSLEVKILENDHFKDNPFNYFMPFYENNPSIDKLYEKEGIEDIESLIKFINKVPLSDSMKYLLCNSDNVKFEKVPKVTDLEQKDRFKANLNFLNAFYPYLNHINTIIGFYKFQSGIALNEKLNVISVKNINEHLLNTIEKYRALARQFMIQKEWGTAITNLNILLKTDSNDIEALLALIQCYDNTEKGIDDKLKLRKQIESIKPNIAYNLYKIAHLYGQKKHFKEALSYFDKAINIDKTEAIFYHNRGITKSNLDDYRGAIEDYSIAIKINPKNAIFYHNRGNVKNNLEDYEEAIEDYNRAIEIDPKNGDYYSSRGNTNHNLKDYEGAIKDYNKAIEIDPKNGDYYSNRGDTKNNLKDYEGAIKDYNKAIEIDPKNGDYYSNRGSVRDNFKKYKEAIEDFNKVILLNNKNFTAYSLKANTLRKLSRFIEAHNLVEKAIIINPNESKCYGTKAAIFSSEGNENGFYEYATIAFEKGAKAAWFDDDIKEKYRNEPRFQALLEKYKLSLDEE